MSFLNQIGNWLNDGYTNLANGIRSVWNPVKTFVKDFVRGFNQGLDWIGGAVSRIPIYGGTIRNILIDNPLVSEVSSAINTIGDFTDSISQTGAEIDDIINGFISGVRGSQPGVYSQTPAQPVSLRFPDVRYTTRPISSLPPEQRANVATM